MDSDLPVLDSGPPQSAVSWGAVLAGAVAALAVSYVLLALAGGLGFLLFPPWPGGAGDVDHFTPYLGAGMIAIQVLSSALGGYLAGRLRTRWTHIHDHETHFRDTAHGLLAWAASLLIGAVLMGSVLAPMANRAAAVAAVAAAQDVPAAAATVEDPNALAARAEREAGLTAQASLFMGIGLLLGAFTASVAAAIGGLRTETMHTTYWEARARI